MLVDDATLCAADSILCSSEGADSADPSDETRGVVEARSAALVALLDSSLAGFDCGILAHETRVSATNCDLSHVRDGDSARDGSAECMPLMNTGIGASECSLRVVGGTIEACRAGVVTHACETVDVSGLQISECICGVCVNEGDAAIRDCRFACADGAPRESCCRA